MDHEIYTDSPAPDAMLASAFDNKTDEIDQNEQSEQQLEQSVPAPIEPLEVAQSLETSPIRELSFTPNPIFEQLSDDDQPRLEEEKQQESLVEAGQNQPVEEHNAELAHTVPIGNDVVSIEKNSSEGANGEQPRTFHLTKKEIGRQRSHRANKRKKPAKKKRGRSPAPATIDLDDADEDWAHAQHEGAVPIPDNEVEIVINDDEVVYTLPLQQSQEFQTSATTSPSRYGITGARSPSTVSSNGSGYEDSRLGADSAGPSRAKRGRRPINDHITLDEPRKYERRDDHTKSDPRYLATREANNEAVRRSRKKKKLELEKQEADLQAYRDQVQKLEIQLSSVAKENEMLKQRNAQLERENSMYRLMMSQQQTTTANTTGS